MFKIVFNKYVAIFIIMHIASQMGGQTAKEYETISNHVISATPSNMAILWINLASWVANAEQIFEHLKCLFLIIVSGPFRPLL